MIKIKIKRDTNAQKILNKWMRSTFSEIEIPN